MVLLKAGREEIAGARPERRTMTKRQTSTWAHQVNPLYSTVEDIVNITASLPNLPSRFPPPTIPAVARTDEPSGKEIQTTGTSAK